MARGKSRKTRVNKITRRVPLCAHKKRDVEVEAQRLYDELRKKQDLMNAASSNARNNESSSETEEYTTDASDSDSEFPYGTTSDDYPRLTSKVFVKAAKANTDSRSRRSLLAFRLPPLPTSPSPPSPAPICRTPSNSPPRWEENDLDASTSSQDQKKGAGRRRRGARGKKRNAVNNITEVHTDGNNKPNPNKVVEDKEVKKDEEVCESRGGDKRQETSNKKSNSKSPAPCCADLKARFSSSDLKELKRLSDHLYRVRSVIFLELRFNLRIQVLLTAHFQRTIPQLKTIAEVMYIVNLFIRWLCSQPTLVLQMARLICGCKDGYECHFEADLEPFSDPLGDDKENIPKNTKEMNEVD